MRPMTDSTDVGDYFSTFELLMHDLEMKPERWMGYIRPLLSDAATDAMSVLTTTERSDYPTVKKTIMATWS